MASTGAHSSRFDEINARLGEPIEPDEMEKLLAEQAKVQDQIERTMPGSSTGRSKSPWMR